MLAPETQESSMIQAAVRRTTAAAIMRSAAFKAGVEDVKLATSGAVRRFQLSISKGGLESDKRRDMTAGMTPLDGS